MVVGLATGVLFSKYEFCSSGRSRSLKMRRLLDKIHRCLGRSTIAVNIAVLARNQCRCIIGYHLGESANPYLNGEAWLAGLVAPHASAFVDVGANKGAWTSLFLEKSSTSVKGLLFDPSASAVDALHRRFGFHEGIEIIPAAVGDASGCMELFEEPDCGEGSTLVADASPSGAERKTVNVVKLDDEMEKRGMTCVDYIKVDAEGYDLHVLRGCTRILEEQRVGVIQFEYGSSWAQAGSTLSSAFRLLNSSGYEVFLLQLNKLTVFDYSRYGEFYSYSNFVGISPHCLAKFQGYIRK